MIVDSDDFSQVSILWIYSQNDASENDRLSVIFYRIHLGGPSPYQQEQIHSRLRMWLP